MALTKGVRPNDKARTAQWTPILTEQQVKSMNRKCNVQSWTYGGGVNSGGIKIPVVKMNPFALDDALNTYEAWLAW